MRILIDARPFIDSTHGGVRRVSAELVTAYAKQFPKDTLICATSGLKRPSLPLQIASLPNVTHHHIFLPNKLWSLGCMLNLFSFQRAIELRGQNVDVAFFPNLGFIGRTSSNQKRETSKNNGTHAEKNPDSSNPSNGYILLLHDLSFLIEPKWFRFKQRLWHKAIHTKQQIKNASHLLAVSQTTKNDAIRLLGIPADRISVIPIGVGAQFTTDTHADRTGVMDHTPTKPYVLILGKNDPRKNAATAIRAVKELQKNQQFSGIEYVVIDKHIPDADLVSLYKNASAFLYPSWYEGYGLPLHEAAQFGVPCIASTAGALPETAPPGTLFANPAKPHQWVEALKLALAPTLQSTIPSSQTSVQTSFPSNSPAWTTAAQQLREKLIGV